MKNIFISGSMGIKNIHPLVIKRIDNIIAAGFHILIGDAKGVDASVQTILKKRNYNNITVFFTGDAPRHNIGKWKGIKVETEYKKNTRLYFTAKDLIMAKECDYGLMIWDSKSTGTLSNIYEVVNQNKISLVFVNKFKKFFKINNFSSFEKLMGIMSESAFLKADKKIKLTAKQR